MKKKIVFYACIGFWLLRCSFWYGLYDTTASASNAERTPMRTNSNDSTPSTSPQYTIRPTESVQSTANPTVTFGSVSATVITCTPIVSFSAQPVGTSTLSPLVTASPTAEPVTQPVGTITLSPQVTATPSVQPHLLISEFAALPTNGEFIEIYNPSNNEVDLSNVYLSDYPSDYWNIAQKDCSPDSSDFCMRFPPGSVILPKGFIVVALKSASAFFAIYGQYPDYDCNNTDSHAPAMLGKWFASSGLTNAGEMLILFLKEPSSVLVQDLDYVSYGNNTHSVFKTPLNSVLGLCYKNDSVFFQNKNAPTHDSGHSVKRLDYCEGREIQTNGNGVLGHDETSEDTNSTFGVSIECTPWNF